LFEQCIGGLGGSVKPGIKALNAIGTWISDQTRVKLAYLAV